MKHDTNITATSLYIEDTLSTRDLSTLLLRA